MPRVPVEAICLLQIRRLEKGRKKLLPDMRPQQDQKVPTELVLASGAGLDPHITQQAALFQSRRVAEARGIAENRIRELIAEETEAQAGELFADSPLINVLEFNLLLDEKSH